MLDEPRKPFHWGNEGAAIAFRRIMKRIINMDDSINPPKTNETHEIFNDNNIIANSEQKENLLIPLSLMSRNLDKISVPELRGYSMRKAMNVLNREGLKIKVKGNGVVIWQTPKPGALVEKETVCILGME